MTGHQSTRYQEAVVFKIKGMRAIPVFKAIIDMILSDAEGWVGPGTCVPVFRLEEIRPGETTDLPWSDRLIPNDHEAIERLLLASDDIESIQHKRNFLPDEKPKPRVKTKPEPKGPFSAHGHDLSRYSSRLHPYFDNPNLVAEADDLRELMKGYPFKDKTPLENSRWIEMAVRHRLRDRFPTLYDLDIVLGGVIKECLTLAAKPEIQKHGTPDHFNLAHCFKAVQPPNVVHSHLAHLQGLEWMIKTGRLKDRDRKIVDPSDEEASQDKYFTVYGGSHSNDRDFTDDLADTDAEAEAKAEAEEAAA